MVSRAVDFLSKFPRFRREGEFIDVRLKVREDIFPAHRIVLAASSDYFYAMFTDGMKESNQEVIELKDESISPDAFKIVMDSIYTGELNVSEENVLEVLAVADHLQATTVVEQCCVFLKRKFDHHNYCLLFTVADRHGLRDLQEVAEKEMASMFKDVCRSEEFLTHIGADQLFSLLSRDDLNAPSETFVFKSVMQWIKHKKEERMAVAAKVIGAVRLGLVDIRVVIEELDTEEMKRDPEIYSLMYETSIFKHMPSHSSKFSEEKSKPRSTSQVLVAVQSREAKMQYFDAEDKTWHFLATTIPATKARFHCAVSVDSKLLVAGRKSTSYFGDFSDFSDENFIFQYDTETNKWETLPHSCGKVNSLCIIDDYMYAISADSNQVPRRYSFAKRHWQNIAPVAKGKSENNYVALHCGAVVNSKMFVLYDNRNEEGQPIGHALPALLKCFDTVKNEWEVKAKTCQPHYGSSLIVVNSRLYVAGGHVSVQSDYDIPSSKCAPVEMYNEKKNTWSVVEQKHIPPNNLGAVEIEGRVYFTINNFPVDSGIRIPPGEVYPVPLGEWENLAKIEKTAVLCYLPVKRESLSH